jgi:23S rRNA (guanine2445-N2)-methyltransferase / 23S rRNA (guanine2069-N7)-methyltransferase
MGTYFATAARGTEYLLAEELRGLGATGVTESRSGVYFSGDLETAYRVCLWSRVASRVLKEIGRFPAVDADALYAGVRTIDWPSLLEPGASIAVEVNGTTPELANSHFSALRIKDAVVDSVQEAGLERPSVDVKSPGFGIFALLRKGEVRVSFDLAGRPLHRRGYRQEAGEAPLRETLAAALLLRCGWPDIAANGGALLDPMCGSGTLPIEAAMMAADIAPGLLWGTTSPAGWRGHELKRWHGLMVEAADRRDAGLKALPTIVGVDHDASVLAVAERNAARAGLAGKIAFSAGEAASVEPPAANGLVITNPPYGERIAHDTMLVPLYAGLGKRLRERFDNWHAAVLTPTPELGFHLGLRSHRQGTFWNGAIECQLLEFEIHPERAFAAHAATDAAEPFANRLRKNLKQRAKWAKRAGIECYRVYDADLPEYALAVDLYGRFVHVQEYAPPKTVDAVKARRRLDGAMAVLPAVLGVAPSDVFLKQRQRGKGGARYGKLGEGGRNHEVGEGPARFWVNFTDHLDTGLFLDHRPIREYIRKTSANKTFLNLFCYTATATVHAVLGGAKSSTSVDMSRTYLDWARRNFLLNGVDQAAHELVQADCTKWLAESGDAYDLIFLDPPTFSSSKRMEGVLDVQRDHVTLIRQAVARLAKGGELLFSTNNQRFRLDTDGLADLAIEDLSPGMLPEDFKRTPRIHRVWRLKQD